MKSVNDHPSPCKESNSSMTELRVCKGLHKSMWTETISFQVDKEREENEDDKNIS
jgi:hypothetical protein